MVDQNTESGLSFTRPPIVEAVIERRFAVPFDIKALNTLRDSFERDYPAVSQMVELEVKITSDAGSGEARQALTGYKLVDHAGTSVILITTQAIAFARVAPYPGWTTFSAEAANTFRRARDTIGYSTIARLGVRYVNRLDIPIPDPGAPLNIEDYILINVSYPRGLLPPPMSTAAQCVSSLPDIDSKVTINVATVPPPVPRHYSVVFDIDIGRDVDVPQREDDIAAFLTRIRIEKNRLFAACLTDKMKELFH